MIDVVKQIKDTKAKKIKRYPCDAIRGSSIGYFVESLGGCSRRGVYEITHWQEKQLHDIGLQLIFDEGNAQEKTILKDFLDAGINMIHQQIPAEFTQYKKKFAKVYPIRGHIDGKILEDDGTLTPIDMKSCSTYVFPHISTYDEMQKSRFPWIRGYCAQMQLYLFLHNLECGIILFKDKSTGNLKQVEVNLDLEFVEEIIQTAEKINEAINEKKEIERIKDRDACKKCPFNHICLPDINWGEPLQIEDDPLFEKKLDRYYELEAMKKEAEELGKSIKNQCQGRANVLVGKYHITGKEDARGAWRKKIELLTL